MPFLGLGLPLRTGGGKICRVKTILRVYHILFVSLFLWSKRISLSQIFRCRHCHHIVALELELTCGQGQERKTTVDPSKLTLFLSYGGPSSHSLEQKGLLVELWLSIPGAQFWDTGFLLSPVYDIQKENKTQETHSYVCCTLSLVSSPLPFTFAHYLLLFRGLRQLLCAFCLWLLVAFTARWRMGCAYSP